jgi:hypothetical protein
MAQVAAHLAEQAGLLVAELVAPFEVERVAVPFEAERVVEHRLVFEL